MPGDLAPPFTREEFDVAILCAKKEEWNAVEATFDIKWKQSIYGKASGDENAYLPGRIGNHNVVLAYLYGMGTASSGSTASSLRSSFPRLRLGLVVGICGGVPFINGRKGTRTEVLLGDVIISTQVLQYRYGHQNSDKFVMKDTLDKAKPEIRAFLNLLKGNSAYEELQSGISTYLSVIQKQKDFKHLKYPGANRDKLYSEHHRHKHREPNSCEVCENGEDSVCEGAREKSCEALGCHKVVDRRRLVELGESSAGAQIRDPEPLIHFGAVASGDLVMRSGHHRDEEVSRLRLRSGGHDTIAFEMEGAGVWEILPTIVIKGVSDYADSHKRDEWQEYAAARAAACMKATLEHWSPIDIGGTALYHYVSYTPQNHMIQEGTPRSSRSSVGDKINRAEALIKKRVKESMKQDLEEAQELLMQVRNLQETLSSDFLRRVYWGLMIAEKELSCHGSFVDEDKISHITKAEEWNSRLLSQNLDTGPRIHVERYIIQGRKASLKLRMNLAPVEARQSKADAIDGIDRMLEDLKENDPNKYTEIEKHAREWRASILRTSS